MRRFGSEQTGASPLFFVFRVRRIILRKRLLSSAWSLAWLAPAFAFANEAFANEARSSGADDVPANSARLADAPFRAALLGALKGEPEPGAEAGPPGDEGALQREFTRYAVVVNGHWSGFSWLATGADGKPCAEVADWLEWGVMPAAEFAAQADAGDARCVMPQRSQHPHDADAAPPDIPDDATPEEREAAEEALEEEAEPAARVRYDAHQQQLNVRITDSLMSRARGYVPPARLDNGVDAVRFDYQLSASHTEGANALDYNRRTSAFATLNAGANVDVWQFRSNHVYSSPTIGKPEWERLETYVQRDVRRVRGKLLLGDGATDSLLFDSIPFSGAQLASDDNLLPDHLSAAPPVVRGNAHGSAEVFIRQRGLLFYHAVVAPGPFAFYDVRPPSSSGDLSVTVREADGTEHVSVVPFIAMPLLVHQDAIKYAFSAGRYRRASMNAAFDQPPFVQATLGIGLPHRLSAFGGALQARGYRSMAAGLGWDLGEAGALSFDLARSQVDAPSATMPSGLRFRTRYAKSFASTGTGMSVDWRQFGGGHFRTMEDMLQREADAAFWRDLFGDTDGVPFNESAPRRQIRLNVQQNVGDTGNLYATLSANNYASSHPARGTLQLGATWYGDKFDVDLQAGIRQIGGTRSKSFQATLSIPLSLGSKTGSLRYGLAASRDDDGALVWSNSLSGSALRDYRFNYALTQQHSSAVGSEGTGHVSYQGDGGRLDAGYGQGRGYRKVDMAVAGSVVGFHSRDDRAAQGIVLGQSLGDTIAVVDAPGYADASVDGQLSTRTDARGRAIISYLTPYRVNRVGLDSLTAGEDLDYGSLLREVAPVSGSVLYVPIHPQKMPGLDSR